MSQSVGRIKLHLGQQEVTKLTLGGPAKEEAQLRRGFGKTLLSRKNQARQMGVGDLLGPGPSGPVTVGMDSGSTWVAQHVIDYNKIVPH